MTRVTLEGVLRPGQAPWRPSPDVTDVRVLLAYGHPRVGTFRIGLDLVLFATAYDDDDDDLSVWAYVPVPAELEASFLGRRFDTAADLSQAVDGFFVGRPATMALANNMSLARWSICDEVPAGDDGLTKAATGFMWSVLKAESFDHLQAAVKLAEARDLVNS